MKSYNELLENDELFIDEEDKREILALPELKREKILHDRFKKINDTRLSSSILRSLDREEAPRSTAPKVRFEECDFILTRDLIMDSIFKPFIGLVKGCFVRAMINKRYVICKVMAVKNGKPYKLMTRTPQMCTVVFDVDSGKKIIEGIEVNCISSSGINAQEFEEFVVDFEVESFDDLRKKQRRVASEFTRVLTNAELTKTIENRLRDNPKKQTMAERKIEIITKRDEAVQNKDKEKAMEYQKQLEAVEDEDRAERNRKLQEENEKKRRKARL